VTKLFQSPDGNLKRMTYLFIKEVAESTDPSSVIIVVQSLVKDVVNDAVPLYKSNAIRVLSKIVDSGMLGQVERYYKQAIVDRDDGVAAAALASSLYLLDKPGCGDIIARWTTEVQTVLANTRSDSVQFLALAVLRSIKRSDRLAVSKVVQTLIRTGMRSALGICLLIRYTTQLLLAPDVSTEIQTSALNFLESCLRHKNEMVIFEAARALVAIPSTSPLAMGRDIGASITVLQMFLSSPKPTLRYAAVRTLSSLASSYPGPVSKCNEELEAVIGDANRTIGTLAITTLLRTASESTVDRLMKQISGFMSDVGSDELKVVVVKGIHELALRTPGKHRVVMTFLATALRDEGGYEFKKALLDGLLDIMEAVPDTKVRLPAPALAYPRMSSPPTHPPCRPTASSTCASSSRTASSRPSPRACCTCWARRAPPCPPHSPPPSSASSTTA
jgi:coatomer protein complex subunit gamma